MPFKKYSLFLSLWFIAHVAVGQLPREKNKFKNEYLYNSIVKVNLLSPFIGTINVHYEYRHNENNSSQFEFFYFSGQFFGLQTGALGMGLTYNYRTYITGTFPKGKYIQPFIRYQQYWPAKPSVSTAHTQLVSGSIGVVLGYQSLFAQRITLDLFAGPVYSKAFLDGQTVSRGDVPPFLNGPWVRLGFTLGYAF